MEHRQRFLIPLAAADGTTNSYAPSADLYLSGDFSIPPPPISSINAIPLFPQDQLMKFLATVGDVDVPSPDLINPTLQPWNQLGDGLSELHQLPSLPFSDLPLVLSGESSNERFSAIPFPPPMSSINATPLFPQDQLMKFLATIGVVDVPSPDLINPTLQHWNQLGNGLSELYHLPSLPFSDLPLVLSGESSNERFSAIPFLPPPSLPSSNQKGKATMTRKLERRRRSTMGDRIRILEWMMSCGEKMNTVTLLEELPNYVKLLEAQVTVLQLMLSTHSGFGIRRSVWRAGAVEQAAALRQAMAQGPEQILDGTVSGNWIAWVAEPTTTAKGNDELSHGTGLIELFHSTGLTMLEGWLYDIDRANGGGTPMGNDAMPRADASTRA